MPTDIIEEKQILQTSDASLDTDSIEDIWRTRQHTARAWWRRWQQEYLSSKRSVLKQRY